MKIQNFLLILVVWSATIGTTFSQSRKSVSILGDSYSTFEGFVTPDTNSLWYYTYLKHSTDVSSVTQTWWHRFIRQNGYRLCVNNSFSGSTICHTGYRMEDYSDRSFVSRMKNLGCPDVIFIFGGTNDSWAGVPLGEYRFEHWTAEELYQFRPAMAYMLAFMNDYYPHVEIYFLLNSELREEINESVRTICRNYGVDCIELRDIDKMGNHPSVLGMAQISEQITEFLSRAGKLSP
ncbi:MAG: SGNH/GDSL hydrolase family protein [Rikenellaceae bacterium]|nr:SGNH/GDSL hydrolase family protein [Rikenellaceae bacterium]